MTARNNAFLAAVQFLTRVPVPARRAPTPETIARSVLYYPLVGALMGVLLAALDSVLVGTPTALAAAIVLVVWIALSGALHLDGLADSADAWIGGAGSRERTLAIMKDPYCGPMAVVALLCVVLLKFVALANLGAQHAPTLVCVPALARAAIPLLFATTPYARARGLGTPLRRNYRRYGGVVVTLFTIAIVAMAMRTDAVALVAIFLGTFLLLRYLMMKRLGGTTGDTAGALIELSETAMLVTVALLWRAAP